MSCSFLNAALRHKRLERSVHCEVAVHGIFAKWRIPVQE